MHPLLQVGHLLDLLRGLAAGDDDLIELLEKGVVIVLLLPLLLLLVRQLCGTRELLEREHLVHRVRVGTRRHVVAGNRIQPRDDTVEEAGDGEESDEDLDGM